MKLKKGRAEFLDNFLTGDLEWATRLRGRGKHWSMWANSGRTRGSRRRSPARLSVVSALGKKIRKVKTLRVRFPPATNDTGHRVELVTYIRLFLPKAVSWKR